MSITDPVEVPLIRVRAVARGFTSEQGAPHGETASVGRTRDPGELFDICADEVSLTSEGGWMEAASPADRELLEEFRAAAQAVTWQRRLSAPDLAGFMALTDAQQAETIRGFVARGLGEVTILTAMRSTGRGN